MIEEKEVKEKSEEEEGDAPKPGESALDKYHVENDRREVILKQENELQDRRERLHTEQMLGGRSEAGQVPPPKETEDEKWAKDARERYAGTGMDPTPDETK